MDGMRMRKVRWSERRGRLIVVGTGVPANAMVEILDGETGELITRVAARRKGSFRARVSLDTPPCTVEVVVDGTPGGVFSVDGAAGHCGTAGTPGGSVEPPDVVSPPDRPSDRPRPGRGGGDEDDDDDEEEEDEEDDD